jgi:hypothetical protein
MKISVGMQWELSPTAAGDKQANLINKHAIHPWLQHTQIRRIKRVKTKDNRLFSYGIPSSSNITNGGIYPNFPKTPIQKSAASPVSPPSSSHHIPFKLNLNIF